MGAGRRGKSTRAMLCESVGMCSLCGLRIPNYIVSPDHPLFGTIDHVIPRSRGGKDNAANRKPAHKMCNKMKGNALQITEEQIKNMRGNVRVLLIRLGETVSEKHMRLAEKRGIHGRFTGTPPITLQVWMNEGGALGWTGGDGWD